MLENRAVLTLFGSCNKIRQKVLLALTNISKRDDQRVAKATMTYQNSFQLPFKLNQTNNGLFHFEKIWKHRAILKLAQ